MGLWVTLLGVNEAREKNGVPNEKYRSIVAYQIPIAFLTVKLHSKAPAKFVQRNKF